MGCQIWLLCITDTSITDRTAHHGLQEGLVRKTTMHVKEDIEGEGEKLGESTHFISVYPITKSVHPSDPL